MPPNKVIRMNRVEWYALGESRFGPDPLLWAFVCPSCGHVQRPADFAAYEANGAGPETAMWNCIGRYDGHGNVPLFTKPGPCNYTGGGLFCLNPVLVVDEAGKEHRVFAFAEQAPVEVANV